MVSRDTDQDWQVIAEKEPYWGVLSQPAYKTDSLSPERIEEFYQSGEVFISNLVGLIKARLNADFNPKRVLDFGCGVGRLLLPMAKISEQAVGIDIAPGMLKLCSERSHALGINNVTLVGSVDDLSESQNQFDLVNSYIVLQHIPPERGCKIIEKLIRLSSIGGVVSLQVTYAKARRFMIHEQNGARYYRRDGDVISDLAANPDNHQPGLIKMYDYDLNNIFAIASIYSGSPMIVLPTNDDDHLGMQIIFQRARG